MGRQRLLIAGLMALSVIFMSVPFLVPHLGWVALFGMVPLLCADLIAEQVEIKRFWLWVWAFFAAWNAATVFWIWNATAGGAVFAIVVNAGYMTLTFNIFRYSKRCFGSSLPYVLLAVLWLAMERLSYAFPVAFPWLTLGNSFARTVSLAQWYEFTGVLGGSLWVLAGNLAIFGLLRSLAYGNWDRWNGKARFAATAGLALALLGPAVLSKVMYARYEETSEPVAVAILQPNLDPYQKFQTLTRDEQNAILDGQLGQALGGRSPQDTSLFLVLSPETFTNDVLVNDLRGGRTWNRFNSELSEYSGVNLIMGASSREIIHGTERPSYTARPMSETDWMESHNSAFIVDGTGREDIYHKSRLVVGVEMTPWPRVFCPIDDMLGGVMGRDVPQEEASCLEMRSKGGRNISVGTAICYESVYGEYCTEYVKKGARLITVITNDAWWGDTPGYRQHLSYSSLRAIETRRDVVRCGNTGISAIIDQRGDVLKKSSWWQQEVLTGSANLSDRQTFFVRTGDVIGRVCSFLSVFLLLSLFVRVLTHRKR